MPSGRILKGIGGFYYVLVDDEIYECKARGIFRKDATTPLPGDIVEITVSDDAKKLGNIDQISERASELVRPAVANVDQLALVISAKSPAPDYALIDKMLITANMKGIEPLICFNKVDLCSKSEYLEKAKAYEATGYEIIFLSSVTGEGFKILNKALKDKITVFAGQSGVGKSTILNHIFDTIVMQTGDMSKIARGKHTTRHAELLLLKAGGFVADTPGFSSLEMPQMEYNELELYYPEFQPYLNKCRFVGCSHINEPDCAIKNALLEGKIDQGRYDRYVEFYTYLKENRTYTSKKNKEENEIKAVKKAKEDKVAKEERKNKGGQIKK